MSNDKIERQVMDFYNDEGWVPDDTGKVAEDVLFRDVKGGRGAYGEKVELQPRKLLEKLTGTLLIVGGGDLPASHLRAAECFQKVVCVDISQRALDLNTKKLGDKGEYYNASALNIPLPDESVDAVLCAHMLYHVDRSNQERAVSEMIRVTKPGGKILVIYSNSQAPLMLIQRFLKVLRVNKLFGKAKLYVYNYLSEWWNRFNTKCNVAILPNDAISTNQAKALLPTIGIRKSFFQWASEFQDSNPVLAAKLWSYIMVVLDKQAVNRKNLRDVN